MPYSNGKLHPELNEYATQNNQLRLLLIDVDEIDIIDFTSKLDTLKHYINDHYNSQYKIEVIFRSTIQTEKYKEHLNFTTVSIDEKTSKLVGGLITQHDIDVVFSKDNKLLLELIKNKTPVETAESLEIVELQIEAFLTGKEIAWSFNNAVWNSTWLSKYYNRDSLYQSYMSYLLEAQSRLSYTSEQIEYVRAIVNKVGQVRHAEEILVSFLQKKNKSERNNKVVDTYGYESFYDYSFEISFHLGNYYFLMSGCLDILGRLLNNLYSMGLAWNRTNIENLNFQTILSNKNKPLSAIISVPKTSEWVTWLKRRRNHIAHAAAPNYSNLITEKKVKLTDTEVNDRISQMPTIQRLIAALPSSQSEGIKIDARFNVRLHEDYKIVTRDAMQVEVFNNKTGVNDKFLFHPLLDVKLDYEKFSNLMSLVVKNLTK